MIIVIKTKTKATEVSDEVQVEVVLEYLWAFTC